MSWQDAPVGGLNTRLLAEQVLKLPLVALQLGHLDMEDTERYTHPAPGTEAEFVSDVMSLVRGHGHGMTVEQMVDKWYGGREGAMDLLRAMWLATDSARPAHTNGADREE